MLNIDPSDRATYRTAARLCIVFAVLHCALFIASLIVVPLMAPGTKIPNPFGQDDASRAFFLNASSAIRTSAFLQVLSACCLAGLCAAFAAVQRTIKASPAALFLTLSGGLGGAVLLVFTGLFSWALASPGAVDPGPALHTLQFVPFLLGGPGWAGFFALFLAGVAAAGRRALPGWLTGFGVFLSIVAGVATLVLLTIWASPCLPIARFLGFVWLILVAILLARNPAATS